MMKKSILVVCFGLFLLVSCKENPNNTEESNFFPDDIYSLLDNGHYDGYLYATRNIVNNNGGGENYHNTVYSYFYDSTHNTVVPSNVKLNGVDLELPKDYDRMFTLDGTSNLIWEVTGANGIPSFIDTTVSLDAFSISSPVALDTVSKSSGFTINYSTISNVNEVYVRLEEDTPYSQILIDSTLNVPSYEKSYQSVYSDDGTIEFTSSNLSTFNTNRIITVEIIAFKSHVVSVLGKDFIIGSVIINQSSFYLSN